MKNVLMILQFIPAIIGIITSLEAAIPMSGQGKAKLELVKSFISIACDTATEIWPAIEKIVAAFVAVANSIGAFNSSTEAK